MYSDDTGQKQAGRFQKGRSGNPAGRPRGAKNSVTLAAETMLEDESARLTRKCIELALAGDVTALKLCLERIVPVRRDRPVQFAMPPLTDARSAADLLAAVAAAMASAEITPLEAEAVAKVIGHFVKAAEVEQMQRYSDRIDSLTDEQLMRIAMSGPAPRLITISD